jgi:hypothetical protein
MAFALGFSIGAYRSIGEFVDAHFVGKRRTVTRVDVANVLSEDFQTVLVLLVVLIIVSVLLLELIERRLKVIFAVSIDVLAHGIEENAR